MSDLIVLKDLRITTICGALPEETVRPQPFRFDIEVETDLGPAGCSDDLADTINYGDLTDRVVAAITSQKFTLLERMAQVAADVVLAYPQAQAVTVSVDKLRPPVPHALETSGVRITRRRAATPGDDSAGESNR